MFYIVFVLVILGIGVVNLDPLLAWMEERDLPSIAMSAVMILTLGLIPAALIGAGILGDTVWRTDRRKS